MNHFTPSEYAVAALFCFLLISGVVIVLFKINTQMRRSIKETGDDRKIELEKDSGDTLHAEGIYGRNHPEEAGLPLEQRKRNA